MLPPACLPALLALVGPPNHGPSLLEGSTACCPALIWHSFAPILLLEGSRHITIFLCRQDKVLLNISYSSEACCTKEGKDTNRCAVQQHKYPTVPLLGRRESILQGRHWLPVSLSHPDISSLARTVMKLLWRTKGFLQELIMYLHEILLWKRTFFRLEINCPHSEAKSFII